MDDRDIRAERRDGIDLPVAVRRPIARMSGFTSGKSVSKYERRGKNGRFVAPAVYRPTIPKWLYSSTSSGRRGCPLDPTADGAESADARIAEPREDELPGNAAAIIWS